MPVSGRLLMSFKGHCPTHTSLEARQRAIGPYEFSLKVIWTNGSQISRKVLVYTGRLRVECSSLFVCFAIFGNLVLSTSDFQSEVGEVFGEIGGELPAKFGRRFSSFFCWENRQKHFPPKLHRKFHHQTSLRGSGLWRAL